MTWQHDCMHARWHHNLVPYGDGWVAEGSYLVCALGEDACIDDCPDYEGASRIEVRVNSPYDCGLEDI